MRYHTTTRQVLDDDGKQIGFEQVDVPFTAEEEAEADQAEATWALDSQKRKIVEDILKLEEAITSRRRDEAILGIDNGWLSAKRQQIAALREKL